VLNLVPRHQEIVGSILGVNHAAQLTTVIGISEILMAFWILSGYLPRLNAISQMVIIAIMNILEFLLVPELLLWGRFNLLFAFLFIFLIFYNEFYLRIKSDKQT
jgi:uncharacterized membrane protein YphA (DoxX/SURF4 family)